MGEEPESRTEGMQQSLPEETVRDSVVMVEVAQDRMAAYVTIVPAGPGGKASTVDDVLAKLEESRVAYGVDLDAVRRAVRESQEGLGAAGLPDRIQVAWGRPPVSGEDARIDYHEVLVAVSGRPRVLEDGKVNLFELNTVRNVPKGTVLAVKTPPTPGEPGVTVLGTSVPARPGRDLRLKAGKGAALSEDGLRVVAEIDGHATLIDERVEVTSVIEVPDVGVETGNIDFVGSVVVRGNVQPGFRVKAGGDVEVQGGIDGGSVEARGNVTVQFGIQGGGRGKVVAGGAVKARFVENAEVRAGTHVWATDGILQSRVEAGVGVEVLGRRGAIIGGRVLAKNNVAARFLGSALGSVTEIVVGVLPSMREELLENRKKQAELEASLQRIEQTLQYLADHERCGRLSQDKREMMSRLVQSQEQLFAELAALRARHWELESELGDVRAAWVHARDLCYPGVRVSIGNALYTVTSAVQSARFRLGEDGEIEVVFASSRGADRARAAGI